MGEAVSLEQQVSCGWWKGAGLFGSPLVPSSLFIIHVHCLPISADINFNFGKILILGKYSLLIFLATVSSSFLVLVWPAYAEMTLLGSM